MGRHCSVYGCKSNYSADESITTFSLPKSEELKSAWLRKIPRDLSNLKKPAICIKHFNEQDIIRKDCVVYKGEYKEYERKIPKLKEGAVPCIFENVPSYLTEINQPKSRRLIDVEEDNFNRAIKESLLEQKAFLEKNAISNLSDVQNFINENSAKFQKNCFSIFENAILRICLYDASNIYPNVLACIAIRDNLNFEVYVNNYKVNTKKFSKHLIINNTQILTEIIENVEQFVKGNTLPDVLDAAISILETYECDSDNFDNINFIIEQLNLLKCPNNNRRYKNNSLLLASTIYVQSSSTYNALLNTGYLCLPSERTLRSIISSYSLSKLDLVGSINYLECKIPFLKPRDLIVNVLLDEIYIQPMFNFKAGSIYGGSTNNPSAPAKTVQVFMITSATSSYKDVVSIVPIDRLDSINLKEMIFQVLTAVENIGFKVISLISDNNAVNKRAFELLSPNKTLEPFIKHPLDDARLLFILFDSVHMIKSVRNNWYNKKLITFPDFTQRDNLKKASYKHLESMYNIEKLSTIKYGHLLSNKALYPSSIQKQNVKLTLQILNEQNIAALKCISKDHQNLFLNSNETCDFMTIFTTWWKIVNCKSKFAGKRFNDKYREAITKDNEHQVEFLKNFSVWLKIWRQSVPIAQALSSQTFQSLITTTDALIEMIPYLFKQYEIDYILLGKFQTDLLESRFGMYRQMSGSNFYISYLQLLESEKKLRFKSNILISTSNANVPLYSLLPDEDKPSIFSADDIDCYLNLLVEDFSMEYIAKDILPVLAYISGYGSMKELRISKCNVCQNWLQSNTTVAVPEDLFILINELDRGKLTMPSELVLISTSIVHYLFSNIIETFESKFLSSGLQLGTLYKLSCIQLSRLQIDLSETCNCHMLLQTRLENIILISSKIMLNNYTKHKNDTINVNNSAKKLKKFN